ATGRALDAADALSPLSAMAMNLEDSLNALLRLLADWLDIAHPGSIAVSSKAGAGRGQSEDLSFLLEARKLGDITPDELLREARTRGLLTDSLKANAAE